jgi:hypothetical protein
MKNLLFFSLFVISINISSCGTDGVELGSQASIKDNVKGDINHPSRVGRISTRSVDGVYEFFDSQSLNKFTPKGYNYTQVQEYDWKGETLTGHTTFNAEYYNTDNTKALLSSLHNGNFNTVRVFINPFSISEQFGSLNKQYVQNVAHFIKTADEHGLSVIITLDMIPVTYYDTQLQKEGDIWWWNAQYINQSEINLEIDFWQEFILQLKSNLVPLESILAYQIRNEFFFHPDHAPFNNTETVEHANGTVYDLALEVDKAALLETSFLYWSSAVRDAIRNVDNEALVTVGFYAPAPLGTPSNTAIVNSELDFVDLHIYPHVATLSEYDDYFGLMASKDKLIIMGEFGIIGDDYQDAEQVKDILLNWKNDAVTKYHMDGWLMWTWNTGQGLELSFLDPDNLIFKALSD